MNESSDVQRLSSPDGDWTHSRDSVREGPRAAAGASERATHWLARLDALCTPRRAATAIALLASIYALSTMHGHGFTYDEPPLVHAAERTFYWLQRFGAEGTLNLHRRPPVDYAPVFTFPGKSTDPMHYPVLPHLLGAITNWLFHSKLGWLEPVDGQHLGLLILHVAALWAYCIYAIRLFGRAAGIAATLALALYPSALGHSFNNPKDWPCAAYYGVALLALASGVIGARLRDFLIAGVMLGISFAAKFNAAFCVITMLLWAVPAYYLLYYRRQVMPATVSGGYLSIPYVSGAVFFITWPWLYQGSVPDWWRHISGYVSWMVNYGVGRRDTWTDHALLCVLYMTPPLVLLCAAVYLATGFRGDRRSRALYVLLVLWLGVPILRTSLPRSNFYDANRHFIEYVPALCACAGIGAAYFGRALLALLRSGRLGKTASSHASLAVGALATLSLGAIAWPAFEYRPYETTYFNSFIGGLGAAQTRGLFAATPPSDLRVAGTEGDYWFSSARPALQSAAKLLKEGEGVATCGPNDNLSHMNWHGSPKPPIVPLERAALVLVIPREFYCGFEMIRRLEAERPVLQRVTRGGGLIYEILGRPDGRAHEVVTRESFYNRPDWQTGGGGLSAK